MKSPEFIAHGTASSADAKKIESEGFWAQEGRATVSTDLIYAFGWAAEQERRRGSKSETEIEEGETGRIVIMKTPHDRRINVATHTSISVDNEKNEISGYSLKYVGGRKQLGIYPEGDTLQQRNDIESIKEQVAIARQELQSYLEGVGIDIESLKSEDDLVAATHDYEVSEQMEILHTVGDFREKLAILRQDAEPPIDIAKENILLSIVPSVELGEKLEDLKNDIYALKKINFELYTEELVTIIESDTENIIGPAVDIEPVVRELLTTTVEAEVMTMVRSLAMDVKRVQGYAVYNRGGDDLLEKTVDRETLTQKLEAVRVMVDSKDFDMGVESLNRYIKMNLKKLIKELG